MPVCNNYELQYSVRGKKAKSLNLNASSDCNKSKEASSQPVINSYHDQPALATVRLTHVCTNIKHSLTHTYDINPYHGWCAFDFQDTEV